MRRAARLVAVLLCGWVGGAAAERGLDLVWPFPFHRIAAFGVSREVKAADGSLLRVAPTARGERLLPLRVGEASPHLLHALLAAEDRRFFLHSGADPLALLRAAGLWLREGRPLSGGSTLTMQLVGIVEPRPRTVGAKLLEILRARQLERHLGKMEILELYLNLAPLGGTLRGFEAGARRWCGKGARELDPAEAAALVALLPAPTRRSPLRSPDRLRQGRETVLGRMREQGYLSPEAWAAARAVPVPAEARGWPFRAPHLCDLVLREEPGRVVQTGLDPGLQRRVEAAAAAGRSGADGLAMVVLARATGQVAAMVGSADWRRHPWNACLGRRSAGSSLKPFLYALAFTLGVTGPDGLLLDVPGRFGSYEPENFTRDFRGAIPAGEALAHSRNLPAVRLLAAVGIAPFRDLLVRLGLDPGPRPLHLDLALGTLGVSPLELARAWRLFLMEGEAPGLAPAARRQVLAALSRESPAPELLAPGLVAWKTGTSSNRRDAWCSGVAGDYVLVVWVGNRGGRGEPGLTGREVAARLFAEVASGLVPQWP